MTHAAVKPAPAKAAKKPKQELSEGKRAERKLGLLLCAPAALVMIAVTGWPVIYSIWLSMQRYDLRFPNQSEFVFLDNYITVLGSGYWWDAFGLTMLITVVSVILELVLGMCLALIMHRTIVGRGLVRTVSLIPYGIVTVVAAFSWRYAWDDKTGYLSDLVSAGALTDKTAAFFTVVLAEVWKTTPFMALLLMAGLALVPDDLLKAASMDGAGPWQRFTKVMVPVMKPAILVALLFRTLDAFRIFDNLFVLTPGTSSVSIQTYNNLIKGLNLGIGSTMSVLIFITVAIIAFVFIKVFGTAAPGSDPGGKR
ncbi:ABC transporter permease [Actinosynnema sp. ALI-1.44]|uniref:carbohydrate ABC transporter permease n=1 Tax=Actinosynnema sp. ALI-1.44 TaxID=1933779 RepID=UPI00097BFD80|nr:sugar ABC transporter permease [Actinosynnema sp. ALI-1.44]ONI77201.1 ABC transporter permease [Actinosynnema sp. ALI-1.44]